ncbi:MAG TPA: alpha/beta hydrolase-fold protein, partial [Bacteroidia bacterium]|nr:alpha/beta hydrolase-fold protein [Bacteroidia bacterium]
GGYGPNSELAMPEYVQPLEIEYYSNIPHGTIHTFSFTSNILGNSRTIKVYTPPDYDSNPETHYPVILFHDGLEYITLGSADKTIDYLISEERIIPVIAVFVPPVQRDDEYAFNLTQQYESFIMDELVPHIDDVYRTLSDPESRAMVGLSFGGLLTTQICYNQAENFGLAAPYSPSYWVNEKAIFNSVLDGVKKNIKWYIDWGTYEPSIAVNAQLFKNGLEARRYKLKWNEWHEAHSWGSWRAHLDNALEFFFPGSAVNVEDKNNLMLSFELYQNYPNPFNPTTSIEYRVGSLPAGNAGLEIVTLKIYDVLGREVAVLVNEKKPAGNYELTWNAANLPSGVYFYQLKAGAFTATKKLILLR